MAVTQDDPRQLIETAHALADLARPVTLAPFRGGRLEIENKRQGGFDPVTQADRAAEEAMRAHLARVRPQDAILGEEFGASAGSSGLTWILDPIDGTRAYMSGTPTWGVLIAVAAEGQGPLYGIIDQPHIGERFCGGLGEARYDGPRGRAPLATSTTEALDQATIFSTFPEIGSPEERAAFEAVAGNCRLTRYGIDCYAYALLAMGQIDLVIEAGLQSYDIAAPIAVIEAAGGTVCDWADLRMRAEGCWPRRTRGCAMRRWSGWRRASGGPGADCRPVAGGAAFPRARPHRRWHAGQPPAGIFGDSEAARAARALRRRLRNWP